MTDKPTSDLTAIAANQPKYVAHKTVAAKAEAMAQEVYEEKASRDNKFYRVNPDREAYVKIVAPLLRDDAVRALCDDLQRNDLTEDEKHDIFEAIILDKTISRRATAS